MAARDGGTSRDLNERLVEPIDSAEALSTPLPPVTERYFERYYAVDVKGREGEDQCVLQHSNKLCMVCLAPSHPLCMEENISQVDFKISKTVDRRENNPSGKYKKGGQKLTPSSPLCFVHCGKDKKYCLYSCIKGYLVEVNEQLLANPSLLRTNPIGDGYLALVLPKLEDRLTICNGLLSEEDYRSIKTEKKRTLECTDRSDSHSTSSNI